MVASPEPSQEYFADEGVFVNYKGQARAVRVRKFDPPPEEIMSRTVKGGFQPIRLVINLKLVDAAEPDSEISEFDPPVEIRILYKQSDFRTAEERHKPLSLGFWDGEQWIRFTEKHHYHPKTMTTPAAGTWGVVLISRWDDPTISVGT